MYSLPLVGIFMLSQEIMSLKKINLPTKHRQTVLLMTTTHPSNRPFLRQPIKILLIFNKLN